MTGTAGIRADDDVVGPYAPASVARAVRRGQITPDSVLDRPGEAGTVRAADAFPLLFAAPSAPVDLPARLDWGDTTPHPWRRLAARSVDAALIVDLVLTFLVGTFALFRPEEGGAALRFLDTKLGTAIAAIAATVMMIPVSALAVARYGSTPGKVIFGIRLMQDGRRPTFRTMLRRELSVACRGQAFGVPLLSLAANANAFRHLKSEGRTPWDATNGLTVHHRPVTWGTTALLVVFLLLVMIGEAAFLFR